MNQSLREDLQSLRKSGGSPAAAARIAFVQSCWHKDIVDRCRDAFLAEMAKVGWSEGDIDRFEVPGAFEIPLLGKAARQERPLRRDRGGGLRRRRRHLSP